MRTWHDDLEEMDTEVMETTIPVSVVGSVGQHGGCREYKNLQEAKKDFPTLDPFVNTKDFTWAMRDRVCGSTAMRFESWAAEQMYSN